MISTIPYAYQLSDYASCVKPYGSFTQVGQPIKGEFVIDNAKFFNLVGLIQRIDQIT